jgi:NAD(P)-dependent dehydrogenase (short-subunit alcohol dehydrogenase family)
MVDRAHPATGARCGRFAERVALITGAASGIGQAAARAFCAEGGAALLVDIDERGQDVAQELVAAGGQAAFERVDVAQVVPVADAVAHVVARYGALDVLLHAAGVVLGRGVEATSEDEWARVIDVNLKSTFFLAAAVMPHLRQRGGSIVFVASMAGLAGQAGTPAYCASKGGVIALTRALAIDHAVDRVRVNCVCPGSVDTPMMQRWLDEQADPVAARTALVGRQPLGRMAQAVEIAEAMLFLASDSAGFVTGHALAIDGGLFMGVR